VKVKTVGTRITAPGIGDDCRGLAVLLAVARAYQKARVQTTGTVYFVADVGEEGPGDLRGTKYLFDHTLKGKIDAFITIDSPDSLGSIADHAVGSVRYKVTYHGPGGHSFGAFGTVNPIHALGRAIASIADIQTPTTPKTTFSVSVISGGTSVNSIPFEGSAQIDMRSESAAELDTLTAKVRAVLLQARDAENSRWGATDSKRQITLTIDTIGVRPANSSQSERTPIVIAAMKSATEVGLTPVLESSSTDANYPMSLGIPAIRISGGGSGQGAHSLSESYDDGPAGWRGPQWAAVLVAIIAGVKP
jgi:acetylornithine deacetylase/succinyl-diaminopimelate desuccinylase-like protein